MANEENNHGVDGSVTERLVAMEALLQAQQSEIADLKHQLGVKAALPVEASVTEIGQAAQKAATTEQTGHDDQKAAAPSRLSSRRMMLKGGAVAAGAALAGAVAAPRSAAAADGDAVILGANNSSGGGNTRINGTGGGDYNGRNIFTVSDQSSTSSYEAAIGAYGEGDVVYNGLYAYADESTSDPTTGHAVVARATLDARSNILLVPTFSEPRNDTRANARGSLRAVSGDLWYCTSAGTPGVWKKLVSQQSAGALHVIAPRRVYDSRFTDGPMQNGFSRTVSVADAIDPFSGNVAAANIVPDGATAVHFNLTITQTTGDGFMFLGPGGSMSITASTINWSSAGQTIANASLTTLNDDRQVTALAGGNGQTHFIIDITGYTE